MIEREHPNRRSIRLKGYDYSCPGGYFLTIVLQDRACLFGEIAHGLMKLSAIGEMIWGWWQRLPERYAVTLDEFVIMPNHFHGIVLLNDPGAHGDQGTGAHGDQGTGAHVGAPLQQIVRWFKTMTTNEYIRGVRDHGWPRFEEHLWQRNYYEHIIRNDKDLTRIRQYICNNPQAWESDTENPNRL
jgi:putative transposase